MRRILPLLLGAVCALSCGPGGGTSDACKGRMAGDLVITEFLADPNGTDTGNEWIEVFNTLGTPLDLKGVTIYLKKPDGSGLKQHLIKAGTVPANGYFTLGDVRMGALPMHIGYAYGDDLGALPQDTAVLGVKCGSVTLDETTYTKVTAGKSRQLNATLTPSAVNNDAESSFCDGLTQYDGSNFGTPGAANEVCTTLPTGDSCLDNGTPRPPLAPDVGDLIITEVMADPSALSDAVGEWVELKATRAIDLNGVRITNGTTSTLFGGAECIRLAPNEHGVVARTNDAGIPGVRATMTVALANSGGTVSLLSLDGGTLDTAMLPAAIAGTAWQLDPLKTDLTSNDDPASFCRAPNRFGPTAPTSGDFGSPGQPNPGCPAAPDPNTCLEPGSGQARALVKPVVGDLVINEFMADPAAVADTAGEWFEVMVRTTVDLNGVTLGGATGTPTALGGQTCVRVDAGTFLVFANNADPAVNGGLEPVFQTFNFALGNSSGRIGLGTDAGVLDQVTWATTVTAGTSRQLDPLKADPTMNDMESAFCSKSDAGRLVLPDGGPGDRGTPARANLPCP